MKTTLETMPMRKFYLALSVKAYSCTVFAAAVAAYINGAAGELAAEKYGDISMTAGDTVSFISKVTM